VLFRSGDEQLIDPFGGVSDFQNNVLRCVGNAQANILFSPERLVRAARFCQVFQLNLDDDLQACFSDTACLHMLTQVNPDVLLSQLLKWQRDCSPSNIFQFLRNFPDFGFALLQVVGFKWSV
jgi:tRNA nucleotidyltransferase/poly(A) polymerase